MIKISSFSPANNFTRRTWEFYDEHLTVRVKSLTLDYENEIRYERIKAIQNKKIADASWLWVTFLVMGALTALTLGQSYFCIVSSTIMLIQKVLVIGALLFAIPSFRKREIYAFLDSDRSSLAKILVSVQVDARNKSSLLQAIQLIKQKTVITSEVYVGNPLPSKPPIFQLTELDIPDFWNRSTTSFYEDQLIDVERSIVEEVTTIIKYDELTGKTKLVKTGNDRWDSIGSYWLIFFCITIGTIFVFFRQEIVGNSVFIGFGLAGLLLLIPLFLLKYAKNEILIFYNKNDEGVHWTRVNSANREKLEQVSKFVQDKVLELQEKPA